MSRPKGSSSSISREYDNKIDIEILELIMD